MSKTEKDRKELMEQLKKAEREGKELREELKRKWGFYIFRWAAILIAALGIVVGVSVLSVWVGIGSGSALAIIAGCYYLNSTRYVRDAWILEDEIRKEESKKGNEERLKLLSFARTIKRDYQEVDRSFGIAFLTGSVIVLGATMVITMI